MNKEALTTFISRKTLVLQKYSPEILTFVGITGVVATTVLACRATLKITDILEESKETLEVINKCPSIHADNEVKIEYTSEDALKDKTIVYVQTGVKLTKIYLPAIVLGTLSVGCLLGSHRILSKRNLALVAAYKAVDSGFKEYRQRVIDEFGQEVDKKLKFGVKKETIEIEKEDKNGKVKVVKEDVEQSTIDGFSQYARFFDEASPNWSNIPEYNQTFIVSSQNYFNDLLKARGHVFLNEVYDHLGIPRSKAGQAVGWVKGNGDGFVDFGIFSTYRPEVAEFINGASNTAIILDFNVDGIIWDLI